MAHPKRASAPKPPTTRSDKVDLTKPASIVVNRFGGLSKFCRATGFKTSAVFGWLCGSGLIPSRIHEPTGLSYQAYILRCAEEQGVRLKPADFIEQPPVDAAG